MHIKILKSTVAGKQSVKIGQVIQVPDSEGRFLISIGKAAKHADPVAERLPETAIQPEAPKRRKFEGKK